ncbi:hypothetical protein [uncultured Sulfitobacter sp.]|uniref:hypothetical protein n=1 Tax=uncultured Sulfitobacter sp. TaxID=191468 RepID=UPI0030DB32BA
MTMMQAAGQSTMLPHMQSTPVAAQLQRQPVTMNRLVNVAAAFAFRSCWTKPLVMRQSNRLVKNI